MTSASTTRPPERLGVGDVELRRTRIAHADALAAAVSASLDHLAPFMSWANANATPETMRRWLEESERAWGRALAFDYALFAGAEVVGAASLRGRLGPGALEVGYWLRAGCTGRGLMTAAVSALTQEGLSLPSIERIEIHTDLANTASQAIPRRLSYRLDRIANLAPKAPAETGQMMIWVLDKVASADGG